MHRTAGLAAFLLLPGSAQALGVGTTYGLGNDLAAVAAAFDPGGFQLGSSVGFLPSLDLHPGTVTVQIHVLETLGALTNENLWLGANVYFNVVQEAGPGNIVGVVEPGFGVDLQLVDGFFTVITAESRFGVVATGSSSLGVYVVPALGIYADENDVEIVIAGTMQFSVWFGS